MWVFVYTGSSLPPLTPLSLSSLLVWAKIFLPLVNTKDMGEKWITDHVKMKLLSTTATHKKKGHKNKLRKYL